MTHKECMLAAARGNNPDILPFAPRIDLWFQANKKRGTLPNPYQAAESADEISLAEGWSLHKVILEYMHFGLDAIVDRMLGIYRIPTQGFLTHLPEDVERRVEKNRDEIHVEYITPKGKIDGTFVYTYEMRRSGISIPWIKEHVLKDTIDYRTLGYIFENMRVEAAFDGYTKWSDSIGDAGMPVLYALTAGSPMHHIMKILLDATDFYYRYSDQKILMEGLAEKIGIYYRKVLELVSDGPAEVVLVGANFDEMLTYPPFFKEHILPWLQETSDLLHQGDKLMLCHTDGENLGLMDMLLESGMDIAEAVCPFPMTKVTIGEYYRRWCDKITIFGGIPSNILLKDTTSNAEFEAYMKMLFNSIAPGSRFILGIADTTPPDASLERIRKIHELVQEYGRIPIKHISEPLIADQKADQPGFHERPDPVIDTVKMPEVAAIPLCEKIQNAVLEGDRNRISNLIQQSIQSGSDPNSLLKNCLLPPMSILGRRFTDGTVFIPEVLLSARTLNIGMELLEPVLESQDQSSEKSPLVVLGTVKGDLHDIGKNLVGIMFRSAGLRVHDLGINVDAKIFIEAVRNLQPKILALSALLTTTMPEFAKIIDALTEADLRDRVRIMVGGAPVSAHFAKSIGADGYGKDAGKAAQIAKEFCGISF